MYSLTQFQFDAADLAATLPNLSDTDLDALDFGVVEMSRTGLHWDALDEDISIEGLLAGRRDMTRKPKVAA